MQLLGRGVEAARADHRGEGGKLLAINDHISNTNANEESLALISCSDTRSVPNVDVVSSPLILGFVASFTLIAAIGAQNAFVLRQGIRRQHVVPVIALCTASDIALISAGIAGVGALISAHPGALNIAKFGGAAFLICYGLLAARRAWRPSSLTPAETAPARLPQVLVTCAALTFLNPHVYLDTVVLLGALANEHRDRRWQFAVGAVTASAVWFFSLGLGARRLAPLFATPVIWRILDGLIAVTMIGLAVSLSLT
jgi:L-lysine exporter family protein LysE/ArgO